MKRTKKKRKMNSYAMGSGATGTIKNYMPDPNQVFRENQIDADIAKSEAASNPWVMGLDMAGGALTQFGMSMINAGMAQAPTEVPDVPDVTPMDPNFFDYGKDALPGPKPIDPNTGKPYAKGTGPTGTPGVPIEAEKGEVVESPNGVVAEVGGKKHAQGGTPMVVPEGTLIFSDQLKVDGNTMADRKKTRESKIASLTKKLEKDPTDLITKETLKKTQANFAVEEQQDLMLQGFARGLDEVMAAMGTSADGVQSYAPGTSPEGVEPSGWDLIKGQAKDYFGSFTGGDYLGIAGNLFSGISGMKSARDNAASATPNENFYEGYADEAIASIDQAGATLEGQQALGEQKLQLASNKASQDVANSSTSANVKRAGKLGVYAKTNQAMNDMYMNFSKMMMDNLYKKSQLQAQSGQVEAQGATAADIANRQDADNADTQLAVARESFGRAMQQTGKDLNQHSVNEYMANVYSEMFGFDVDWSKRGKLIKTT